MKTTESIKRHSMGMRILSLFLTAVLLFLFVPTVVYAEIANALTSDGTEAAESAGASDSTESADAAPTYTYNGVTYEETSMREETVKHFRLADGSYVAAQYGAPVHYEDENGEWQDINNSLVDSSAVYANETARIKFSKTVNGSETLFTLKDGSTKLELGLIGAIKGTAGIVTNGSDAGHETELQKMLNLENLSAKIFYPNILEGVDIEYVAHSLSVKENIIVNERCDSYSYSFELKLNGMTAALNEVGDIILTETKTGEVKYTIPAPVVYDLNYSIAPQDKAYYTLEGKNSKYNLTVTVDSEWMNDEEREFPVVIDPTITTDYSDTHVGYTMFSTSAHQGATKLDVMRVSSGAISMVPFALPSSLKNSYISSVKLHLNCEVGEGNVGIYAPLGSWSPETTTWYDFFNSQRKHAAMPMDFIELTADESYYSWDITEMATKYASNETEQNFVIMKAMTLETNVGFCNITAGAGEPYLTTEYRNMTGLEDYWATSSHDVGAAGTGTVNLANGNLTFAIPLLSTTDSLMPYTVSAVYNLTRVPYPNIVPSYLPNGFHLNIAETVSKMSYQTLDGNTVVYYNYMDADGTEHAFNQALETDEQGNEIAVENVYVDEDGLQKTLTVSDGYISITDDSKITKRFSALGASSPTLWFMTEIEDASGNKIVIDYNTSKRRPIRMSLQPVGLEKINMINFTYNSSGMLYIIDNGTANDAVVFAYSGNCISKINKFKGAESFNYVFWPKFVSVPGGFDNVTVISEARYGYSGSPYYLSAAIDFVSGYRIVYTLGGNSPATKVTGITEYASNVQGKTLSYTYGYRASTESISGGEDGEALKNSYSFDADGRCVSTYTVGLESGIIYGASMGVYETQENVKNSLNLSVNTGGAGNNLLLNPTLRIDSNGSTTYWETTGNTFAEVEDGEKYYHMNPSSSVKQGLRLEPGKYTFSIHDLEQAVDGYVSSYSIKFYVFTEDETNIVSQQIRLTEKTFSTTFTIPENDNGYLDVYVSIELKSTAKQIKFSGLMLEKNTGASKLSLVGYSEFEGIYFSSTGERYNGIQDWINSHDNNSEHTYSICNNGELKVYGGLGYEWYTKQRVYEATSEQLSAYDESEGTLINVPAEYMVTGFVSAQNAVIKGDDKFVGLRVNVVYYQGEGIDDVTVQFDFEVTDCDGTNFVSGFVPAFEYLRTGHEEYNFNFIKAIDVCCVSKNQSTNTKVYFDKIAFFKANTDKVSRSEYYENGLVKTAISGNYEEYYYYNDNRTVKTVANNRGEITVYEYNSTNDSLLSCVKTYSYESNTRYTHAEIDEIISELENPESTATPKTTTTYIYNTYGLLEQEIIVAGNIRYSTYYLYDTSQGSRIFGVVMLCGNSNRREVSRFIYDTTDGKLLAEFNHYVGIGTAYIYDEKDLLVGVAPATYTSSTTYSYNTAMGVEYAYDVSGTLSEISAGDTYSFAYDVFGNMSSVGIEGNEIVSYEYYENNGNLKKVTYANGFAVEYGYNALAFISYIWYTYGDERELAYKYEYTSDGSLYKKIDYLNYKTTVYEYDLTSRCIGETIISNSSNVLPTSSEIQYDDFGNVKTVNYSSKYRDLSHGVGEVFTKQSYGYNSDGTLIGYSWSHSDYHRVTYGLSNTLDDFSRVTRQEIYHQVDASLYIENRTYTYKSYSGSETTFLVASLSIGGRTYSYNYDSRGNIISIEPPGGFNITYEYDELNRLIRENNEELGKSYLYSYGTNGNLARKITFPYTTGELITPESIDLYSYNDESSNDRLTAYNGAQITYDEIGNPIQYYNGYTFTWQGRELVGATDGTNTLSFTYDDTGLRQTKTVNGDTTIYSYNGSLLLSEQNAERYIVYIYDENGSPVGFMCRRSEDLVHGRLTNTDFDVYWFEKNLQGDVIYVRNENGLTLACYIYDAWGNFTTHYVNGGENTTVVYNTITYRSYYYDAELGFYYLTTRYYDANIGRFISPDRIDVITATPMGLTDKNLYAYCDNNPVMRADGDGEFWHILVGATIGAMISGIVKIASNAVEGKALTDGLGTAMLSGAASGALAATGVGIAGQIVGNAAISMAENATNQIIENGGFENFSVSDMIIDGIVGSVSGGISGAGKGSKYLTNLGTQTVKRTFKTTTTKGFKAGIKELGRAFSYYAKSSAGYYAGVKEGLLDNFMTAVGTGIATSDFMKGQYQWLFRRLQYDF